ncbi:MAG: hypothetical protein KY434_02890 [Actinobacteria bacterium]|nr:hypothetical protein [Actinomycetota bacterium]
MWSPLATLVHRIADSCDRTDGGFSTAELLGNAALGVAALIVIWALLQGLGADVVDWIRGQLLSG